MIKELCPHKKPVDQFCCRCHYGPPKAERDSEKLRDLVDDLNIGFGYKLIRGYNLMAGN